MRKEKAVSRPLIRHQLTGNVPILLVTASPKGDLFPYINHSWSDYMGYSLHVKGKF